MAATNYYVDGEHGDDGNSGLEGYPVETIPAAVRIVEAAADEEHVIWVRGRNDAGSVITYSGLDPETSGYVYDGAVLLKENYAAIHRMIGYGKVLGDNLQPWVNATGGHYGIFGRDVDGNVASGHGWEISNLWTYGGAVGQIELLMGSVTCRNIQASAAGTAFGVNVYHNGGTQHGSAVNCYILNSGSGKCFTGGAYVAGRIRSTKNTGAPVGIEAFSVIASRIQMAAPEAVGIFTFAGWNAVYNNLIQQSLAPGSQTGGMGLQLSSPSNLCGVVHRNSFVDWLNGISRGIPLEDTSYYYLLEDNWFTNCTNKISYAKSTRGPLVVTSGYHQWR